MNITSQNTHQNDGRKAAIYVRVSTIHQVDKDSLPMQKSDCIAYAKLILDISDYEIFEDAGYSGKNVDRPAYQEMMKRIHNREFSHLIVWKIDRISRNLLDFSEMYSELKKLRVVFVSKFENFDTSTAMGEAMLKIILVFAELERNMTSERVIATMLSRAAQGLYNGGRIPYGYNYDPDTKEFSINDEEARVCKIMLEDYLENKSMIHTARLLNETGYKSRSGKKWSQSTVGRIMKNPFITGTYRYNYMHESNSKIINSKEKWIIFEEHHPAIYTQEEYDHVLSISKENNTVKGTANQHNRHKHVHVFGQICYCGICGSKMTSVPGRIHKDGYKTSLHVCRLKKIYNQCSNPALTDLVIGEFVINYIANVIHAKKSFSKIHTAQDLQSYLLKGEVFKDVVSIRNFGLSEIYTLLSNYRNDNSFALISKSRNKKIANFDESAALKKELEKQERALRRLQDLYLYSDHAMQENDYIMKNAEITSRIETIKNKLGLQKEKADVNSSDEDIIKKASHLLINARIQNNEYINYKSLALSTAPDILYEYVHSIIDRVYIANSKIMSITFKNGITTEFEYR